MMRFAAIAVALLLAPVAFAQDGEDPHAFARRYLVDGRLLGANGEPIAGQEVLVEVSGEELTTPCPDVAGNVTDEWGDFHFCWEHRALRSGARMNLTAGGARTTVSLDQTFRRAYVPMRDEARDGAAPEGWSETYHVSGRAWKPGIVEIDGVRHIGEAAPNIQVNLTLRTPAGNETMQTTTDALGDFSFRVTTTDALNSSATVEIAGNGRTILLDATFHRMQSVFLVTTMSTFPTPSVTRAQDGSPGSSTPALPDTWILVGALAALALAGGAWFAWKKKAR